MMGIEQALCGVIYGVIAALLMYRGQRELLEDDSHGERIAPAAIAWCVVLYAFAVVFCAMAATMFHEAAVFFGRRTGHIVPGVF